MIVVSNNDTITAGSYVESVWRDKGNESQSQHSEPPWVGSLGLQGFVAGTHQFL